MTESEKEHTCDIWSKLKRTRQRECVYQILLEADKPVSAAEIYGKILRDASMGEEGFAISTVYRVLQAFDEVGLLLKTTLPDTDTVLYEWNHGEHCHYAICLKCHKRIPLLECPFGQIKLQDREEGGFLITGHKIEIYGYCSSCQNQGEQT